jgi:hypothetical protein
MYIILDEDVRRKFEETHQIPYGYGDGNCYIYENLKDAIIDFKEMAERGKIIENYDKGYRDTVYTYEDVDDIEEGGIY